MNIDEESQRILAHLYHHFRDSATDIAKATGLKRHQVTYRLNKFKENNFIDRFVTLYNYSKLGYNHFHVVWVACDDRKPIRETLYANNNILTYGNLLGVHDMYINYIHATEQAFEEQLHELIADHENTISDYSVFKVTFFEFYDLKEFGEKEHETLQLVEHTEAAEIDETDKRILKLLEQDARKNIADLAQAVHLSSPAIIKRLNKLQNKNIVQSGRALLNMEGLGYNWGEIHAKFHCLSPAKKQNILRFCRGHDHINMLNLGVADYNGIIQVLYQSDNALRSTIRDVEANLGDNLESYRLVLAENEGLVRTLPFQEYNVDYPQDL